MDQKKLDSLFSKIWQDYCQLNPQALKIYEAFIAQGEQVINDHVAYRTLQHPRLGMKHIAKHFEKYGYKEKNEYFFKEKKLYAKHYEHPDLSQPKIFISELELNKLSSPTQKILNTLAEALPPHFDEDESHLYKGRIWDINYSEYTQLAQESEYAAWVSAFGFRSNHFTVSVNSLKKFKDLEQVNLFVKGLGFSLNSAGGEIKGTPVELLEQSSTLAGQVDVEFKEGHYKIPACYYEFARRYSLPSGLLYQGFIAKSADKIFESTNRQKISN
jgi:hypothetical protein